MNSVAGNIYDIGSGKFVKGEIKIMGDRIIDILPTSKSCSNYIIPGFIDSHIHIESSLLFPAAFSQIAITNGTVAAIADPHEIANVLGPEGIRLMKVNADQADFKFYFGAPPCVPATDFETSGATITTNDIKNLFDSGTCHHLAEVMNYPGVIHHDSELMAKINIAKSFGKIIDGHAPNLTGLQAENYFKAGITTDHECESIDEALEKIKYGCHILIREGSAAKNLIHLISLLNDFPDRTMFCTDDFHADELLEGHINLMVKKAIECGIPFENIIKTACINPVRHYKLSVGLLQKGDYADFVVIDSPKNCNILETWINGKMVFSKKKGYFSKGEIPAPVNNFQRNQVFPDEIKIYLPQNASKIQLIVAKDKSLITSASVEKPLLTENKEIIADTNRDILKIVNLSRYTNEKPQVAFIRGFNLKTGAIASSVAHDSHNILAVGTNDTDLITAINLIIASKGGLAAVNGKESLLLPLPYAGLMSNLPASEVAALYKQLNRNAESWGSTFTAPFMTLSFMALLVIPELKLSDKGLFDGTNFCFTSMFR
ncbi:MAG: adenine deaminase [Bacteroidales bacterium]